MVLSDDSIESSTQDIIAKKEEAVQALIELLHSDLFKDPLFPGYGLAPLRAAFALGEIKSEKAIPALFDLLAEDDPNYEEIALLALKKIGNPAKQFLKKALTSPPITKETARAAFTILQFIEDEEIPSLFLHLLQDPLYLKSSFAPYLITGCEALKPEKRAPFFELVKNPSFPKKLKEDALFVLKCWEKK